MTSAPLPYDDASTPAQMTADCEAVSLVLPLTRQSATPGRATAPDLATRLLVPAAASYLADRFAE